MEPGYLCPSHHLTWKDRAGGWCFIFIMIQGGDAVIREFDNEKKRTKRIIPELPDPTDWERTHTRTMEEVKIDAIIDALEGNRNIVMAACRELKISKAMFYRYLDRYRITIIRSMDKKPKRREGDQ